MAERTVDAMDEETLLVPTSHVIFNSAYIQDVRANVEKANSVGALVVLDSYQSTGTVAFSVTDLEVDLLRAGQSNGFVAG